MDFLEIRKRAKAQKAANEPAPASPSPAANVASPGKKAPPEPQSELRTEKARDALDAPGLAPGLLADEPLPAADEPATAPRPAGDPLDEFFFRADEGAGELEDLAAGLDVEAPAAAEEAPQEFLGFVLGGEEYAVELQRIREIVKVPSITEVPRAPTEIAGVISVRGEVMPVFDLHKRLGLPCAAGELSRRARVVIVDAGEGPVGLLVDRVDQVVRLRPSTIEPPPPGLGFGVETEYLAGIGRLRDRMYVLLNLPAVLARPRTHSGERR